MHSITKHVKIVFQPKYGIFFLGEKSSPFQEKKNIQFLAK